MSSKKRYEIQPTSSQTANVNDLVLAKTNTTRKVARTRNDGEQFELCIYHQRKVSADEWSDLPSDHGFALTHTEIQALHQFVSEMQQSLELDTSRGTGSTMQRTISERPPIRKIARLQMHPNPTEPDASINVTLIEQHFNFENEEWVDKPAQDFRTLRPDDCARFRLDSAATLALREALEAGYAIYEQRGVPRNPEALVVDRYDNIIQAAPERASLIRTMLAQGHGDEFWRMLMNETPDLATRLSKLRIQEERKRAVAQLESLVARNAGEVECDEFLRKHDWIFGYGLNYQFLSVLQSQASYGGVSIQRRGEQRGDFLAASAGNVRFTVLVEIKSPGTRLLRSEEYRDEAKKYRNGAFTPSESLAGGISQTQANCQTWLTQGSREDHNRDLLGDILTVQPKGILVIGNLSELKTREQKVAFQLLRQNTVNPEIITFDELVERARFIVADEV